MKKYIIIDTWNGEGYSESNIEIKEFRTQVDAELYCFEQAKQQATAMGTKCSKYEDSYIYSDSMDEDEIEDSGAYHWVELKPTHVGIVLNPCINSYELFDNMRDWDDTVSFAYRNGDEDDVSEMDENGIDGAFIHHGGGDGDALFFELNNGDGVMVIGDEEERDYFEEASAHFLTENLTREEFDKRMNETKDLPVTEAFEYMNEEELKSLIIGFAEHLEEAYTTTKN